MCLLPYHVNPNVVIIARFAFRETMGVILTGVALFWSAGEIGWLSAWVLLGVISAWIVATAGVTLRHSPDLLAERLGPSKGAKRWDTIIMGIYGVMELAVLVIAGLDHRFGWSTGIGVVAQGISPRSASVALAMRLSCGDRSECLLLADCPHSDRARPCGGDRWAVPLCASPGLHGYDPDGRRDPDLLASWWAFAVGVLAALLMILRTILEDRTLQAELPGYLEYARRVRYRLVPGVW